MNRRHSLIQPAPSVRAGAGRRQGKVGLLQREGDHPWRRSFPATFQHPLSPCDTVTRLEVHRATAAKAQIIKRFMGTSVPLPIVLSEEPLQGSTAVPANMDSVETVDPNEFYSSFRPALGTPEAEERRMKCPVC